MYLQRQGSRVSVSSDPSSVETDSTYDQPKTVLKVTSSPLKRRTQQVRLHTLDKHLTSKSIVCTLIYYLSHQYFKRRMVLGIV